MWVEPLKQGNQRKHFKLQKFITNVNQKRS
jgi:hypothetical protein